MVFFLVLVVLIFWTGMSIGGSIWGQFASNEMFYISVNEWKRGSVRERFSDKTNAFNKNNPSSIWIWEKCNCEDGMRHCFLMVWLDSWVECKYPWVTCNLRPRWESNKVFVHIKWEQCDYFGGGMNHLFVNSRTRSNVGKERRGATVVSNFAQSLVPQVVPKICWKELLLFKILFSLSWNCIPLKKI